MKAYSVTIAAALLLSLPAFADDDAARARSPTTIHRDDANVMHRSEQGERNANDPSSPHRALGRERAEERHEMNEHREMQGRGGTSGSEEHRTIRRKREGSIMDKDDDARHRFEMERHEKSSSER